MPVKAVIPDATISRAASPLVMEPLSEESYVPMNLNDKAMKPLESNLDSSQELPEETLSRVRVEPCEFESLLQRAMEILSLRAQSATASRS
jgi:hypothetical protein